MCVCVCVYICVCVCLCICVCVSVLCNTRPDYLGVGEAERQKGRWGYACILTLSQTGLCMDYDLILINFLFSCTVKQFKFNFKMISSKKMKGSDNIHAHVNESVRLPAYICDLSKYMHTP